MAVDKLVDSTQLDADLTSVANAIRTKGGTSSQLAFPAGFVSAVQAIPTGGVTPTGTKQISITANGTTTEDVTNYASAQITANVPNTYSAGDEGKVVSNGALVAQGSDTVTTNDTYDTTLISSLTVNVSGGGSTQVASGEIVVASDISSPSATASKTFPGLALDFVPDMLLIAMTNDSYQDIKDTSTTNHVYMILAAKKELLPTWRYSTSVNTDASAYSSYSYRFFVTNTAYTATDSPNAYGATALGCVASAQMAHWSLNSNGTLSYSRLNSTSQTAIYAGTYRYFAVKL